MSVILPATDGMRARAVARIGRLGRAPVRRLGPDRAATPPVTVDPPQRQRPDATRVSPSRERASRVARASKPAPVTPTAGERGQSGAALAVLGVQQALKEINKRPAASRSCRPRPTGTRPSPTPSRTFWTTCRACSPSRNGATIRGSRSAARACRAISICAASSSTWTASRSTRPTATATSRKSIRPPTNMSRSTRAPTRCGSAPIRWAAPSIS